MDKAHIIAHTKTYMDLLAQGVDPISKEKITDDSVVLQERMKKCFAFVSELLDELMNNNGFVALTQEDAERCRVVVSKKAFSLDEEQIHRISVSVKPVSSNDFLKSINKVVDSRYMEKLSSKSVNSWLLSQGYVVESKEPATINRTIRRPSDRQRRSAYRSRRLSTQRPARSSDRWCFLCRRRHICWIIWRRLRGVND